MHALKTEYRNAEKAKRLLEEQGILAKDIAFGKDDGHIYFPLVKLITAKDGKKISFPYSIVKHEFMEKSRKRVGGFKEALVESGILAGKELEQAAFSFDIAGDVAILEIPKELQKKEKQIARVFMQANPRVKVVARKEGAVQGKYRIRPLKIIAGEKRLATTYKESGCSFKVDLGKIFFSPRLSFERERIANLVMPRETVLVLFAGAGFFAIIAAKRQPKANVVAVELNKEAVKQMRENVKLNKVEERMEVFEGDVNKALKVAKFKRFATRIVMPLPHSAFDFLDAALFAAKKNCVVHFYYIPSDGEEDAMKGALAKVKEACTQNKRKYRVVFKRSVKTYAPHVEEVVVDFKLNN